MKTTIKVTAGDYGKALELATAAAVTAGIDPASLDCIGYPESLHGSPQSYGMYTFEVVPDYPINFEDPGKKFCALADKTDWAMLRGQKNKLAEYQGEDWAEGLLAFLDSFQDMAESVGYPVYKPYIGIRSHARARRLGPKHGR